MTSDRITSDLKALRTRAGLSIRDLAAKLGMSASGYSHYETPARFKEAFLPVRIAREVADALSPYGIDRAEVMRLTGTSIASSEGNPATPPARPGFADAATPFRLRSFAAPPDSAQPSLAAIFGPALATPASYQVTTALPGFGLLPGDVLVCDLARLPMPGELALVTTFDDTAAQATTTVCRYLPPWLVTGAPDAPPLRTDHPGVTVRYPVIGSIRGIAPT